jgi:hypothetical protein
MEVFIPFISFLHAVDKRRGHIMLALMFNLRFNNIRLVIAFLGCENVVIIVIKYDQELLLPLLT